MVIVANFLTSRSFLPRFLEACQTSSEWVKLQSLFFPRTGSEDIIFHKINHLRMKSEIECGLYLPSKADICMWASVTTSLIGISLRRQSIVLSKQIFFKMTEFLPNFLLSSLTMCTISRVSSSIIVYVQNCAQWPTNNIGWVTVFSTREDFSYSTTYLGSPFCHHLIKRREIRLQLSVLLFLKSIILHSILKCPR